MLRAVLVVGLSLCVLAGAFAQDPDDAPWDLEALRGLRALYVVVRPVSASAQEAGLHQGVLRADLEHRLRREGIALVVSPPAPGDAPEGGWAVLRLNVDDLKKGTDPTGYHDYWLSLDLVQQAELAGRPSVRAQVSTWSTGAAGSHRSIELTGVVRDTLRLALDELVRDYRAANDGERAPPTAADSAETAGAPELEGD